MLSSECWYVVFEGIKCIEKAKQETEIGAIPIQKQETSEENDEAEIVQVEDPRELLNNWIRLGVLEYVLPGNNLSKASVLLNQVPSKDYKEGFISRSKIDFNSMDYLETTLDVAVKDKSKNGLLANVAFADYVSTLFSNVQSKGDGSLSCEAEYILAGKDNDYENVDEVVRDLLEMRMVQNYSYLLSDVQKKSEALTLSTAICVAVGTEPMIEAVKYLLLGCWSYGESLCEIKGVLAGEKMPLVKTKENWRTDLKSLSAENVTADNTSGMDYKDCLFFLLVKKTGKRQTASYARMLDIIELNLQKNDENFRFENCVGELTIQGTIFFDAKFMTNENIKGYETDFEETISYTP